MTLKDQKINMNLRPWFIPIQNHYPLLEQVFKEVRADKKYDNKKTAAVTAASLESCADLWLRELDSNQRPRS